MPRFDLALAELFAPVPPLATATTPVTFAAVPVVFWLNVGQLNVPDVKLPEVGVPSAGVTRVGDVLKTTAPVPVDVVTPVPPLATGNVPLTPLLNGSPVAFVNEIVGPFANTNAPVPVDDVQAPPAWAIPISGVAPPVDVAGNVAVTPVTVPPGPAIAAMVIEPPPLVIEMPEPAVKVALFKLPVDVLPINN